MRRLVKNRSAKSGLPPGALVPISEGGLFPTKITVFDYDGGNLLEKSDVKVEECIPLKEKQTVTWINVTGLADVALLEKLGEGFGIHPLVMEDILHTDQRPKVEEFGDHIYLVLKMLYLDKNEEILAEQISLILGVNFVISFQEKEGDVFDTIRERIRNDKGRIRKMGADYLAYSLLDAIVDNYFVIIENLSDTIEPLEEDLVVRPQPNILSSMYDLKRDMIFFRKSVWPLREVINTLLRGESKLIKKPTQLYLKDLYDHIIAVVDSLETFRDLVGGMLDIYLSSISNKMNEIMKVLTIIATIFIPLTFIAGVYGMNFKYMPELEWRWGYFLVLGVMVAAALLMALYFRRRKWI